MAGEGGTGQIRGSVSCGACGGGRDSLGGFPTEKASRAVPAGGTPCPFPVPQPGREGPRAERCPQPMLGGPLLGLGQLLAEWGSNGWFSPDFRVLSGLGEPRVPPRAAPAPLGRVPPSPTSLPFCRFGQKKHLPVAWQPSAARSRGGVGWGGAPRRGLSPACSPPRAGARGEGPRGCSVPAVGTAHVKPPQRFPGSVPQRLGGPEVRNCCPPRAQRWRAQPAPLESDGSPRM